MYDAIQKHKRNLLAMKLQELRPTVYLIPIKYNTKNWEEPDFKNTGTAFTGEWGYGHEEWNNSELNDFEMNGVKWHAFHTQGLWNAPEGIEGENVVFVFISRRCGEFNGLVINPIHNDSKEARKIAEKVRLKNRGEHLQKGVLRHRRGMTTEMFKNHWEDPYDGWKFGFRWKALKENFIWFDNPISVRRQILNPEKMVWGMHYNSPQKLEGIVAQKFLENLLGCESADLSKVVVAAINWDASDELNSENCARFVENAFAEYQENPVVWTCRPKHFSGIDERKQNRELKKRLPKMTHVWIVDYDGCSFLNLDGLSSELYEIMRNKKGEVVGLLKSRSEIPFSPSNLDSRKFPKPIDDEPITFAPLSDVEWDNA